MMTSANVKPDFKEVSLDRLTSVQVRPFHFLENDCVYIPEDTTAFEEIVNIHGTKVALYHIEAVVNGHRTVVPLNALLKARNASEDIRMELVKTSGLMNDLLRTVNALEAIQCLHAHGPFIVVGFKEANVEKCFGTEEPRHYTERYPIFQ